MPRLGALGANALHIALLADAASKAAAISKQATAYAFATGGKFPENLLPASLKRKSQRGIGLGERLHHAFQTLLRLHSRTVVIGADSPELSPARLRQAFRELAIVDAVLGPCPDGGYYLIGLRRFDPTIFEGVRWGSRFAFRDTLDNLVRLGFSCSIIEEIADIDRPADYDRLARAMRTRPQLRRLAPAAWRFIRSIRE